MSITYSAAAITARLNAVVATIGNAGLLVLKAGATTLASLVLASPCGTVSGSVLTFTTATGVASASGTIDTVLITDSLGNTVISGLTVGIPTSGKEVIVSNGLNTLAVTINQEIDLISAQITGS